MTFENHSKGCDLSHGLFDVPKSPGVLNEAFHVLPIFVLRRSIPRMGQSEVVCELPMAIFEWLKCAYDRSESIWDAAERVLASSGTVFGWLEEIHE